MTANPSAFEAPLYRIPGLLAGADLSNNQFYFGKLDSNGNVILNSTAGEFSLGVLQGKPIQSDPVEIVSLGVCKAMGGVAIPVGSMVSVDATGRAKVAASGDKVCGLALTACGGAGLLFTLYLFQGNA